MPLAASKTTSSIAELKIRLADLNAINTAIAIMDWDQQVQMPPGGSEARAEHLSILSRMHHERFISDETRRLLEDAEKEAEGDDAALVRLVRRDLEISTKIPTKLVAEKSRLSAQSHELWVKARTNNDYKSFAPALARMFEITREEAEYYGYTDHIYDALIDLYEEGTTTADCKRVFSSLREPTIQILREIKNRPVIEDSKLYGQWDENKQRFLTEKIIGDIGFDFERGRQDKAAHPFCTNFSISDVRLTTRYLPYVVSGIFSSMHEAGHGMYEQGSPAKWDRTPLAGGVSLGVHESQSRTWENIIGRSKPFWKRYLPELNAAYPELSSFTVDTFYRAINKVQPSLIRVEADELTYNLHVMIRFELECDILEGRLAIKDLPEAWNAKYTEYLGITPRNDAEGCLQDVHWSGGLIGYFPTYAIGNLLSYQIWNTLKRELGDTDSIIAAGNFAQILNWLREKVYSNGRYYTPKELVKRVTGKPLGAEDYINSLWAKYKEIYSID